VQLGLFASQPAFEDEARLAARLPRHVRLGTSSWTFPGWSGLCYPPHTGERELKERGLELYARFPLFGTVGIDRSHYGPLPEAELARYAAQLPPGFTCVMKAWNAITTEIDPRTGDHLATYLDPATFEHEVAGPVRRAFRDRIGAIVLEFPPRRGRAIPRPEAFAEKLDTFLAAIAGELPIAIELRNRELLAKPYLDVLARHRVGHVLNWWEAMPTLGEQMRLPGIMPADVVVARVLLPPGTRYEAQRERMAPFDRLVDESPAMRADVIELARVTAALGKTLFVIVNNKAEGSSPLTVRALAERLAQAHDAGVFSPVP
jgi:uncharacterized protein YecE (DUF72 family)